MRRFGAALLLVVVTAAQPAVARDLGQWAQLRRDRGEQAAPGNPGIDNGWVGRQRMPDNPEQSCCGPADAYWADEFRVINGQFYAVVTDERDDIPLMRPHVAPGTMFPIPENKFKDTRRDPNLTDHGWIWLRAADQWVYCYVNPRSEN